MRKNLILILGLFGVTGMPVAGQDSIPASVLFDDVDRTLKAATSMSVISVVYEVAGMNCFIANSERDNENIAAAGLFLGIGGLGMATNVPILTSKAYRQFRRWECPDSDSLFKRKILEEIRWAKSVAIIQNCLPLVGLAAGGICLAKVSQDAAAITIYAFFGAAMVLAIPEIILIEKVRSDLRKFNRNLSLRHTNQGIGLVYHF